MSITKFSQFYCRHLQEQGDCLFNERCMFSHSSRHSFQIPDHVCFYNLKGRCKHSDERCSFLHITADELLEQLKALKSIRYSTNNSRSNHDQPTTSRSSPNEKQRNSAFKKNFQHQNTRNDGKPIKFGEEIICGICLEDVNASNKRFGLLSNCNHSFCFDCLIRWRKQKNLAEDATNSCPECRLKSDYVVPSRCFATDDAKRIIIDQYKNNCKKSICRFEKNGRNFCKNSKNCLYKHTLPFNEQGPQMSFRIPSLVLNVNTFYADSDDDEISIIANYIYDHY